VSFSKSWNCMSHFGDCNFRFWKTHKCKLIPNWMRKTIWLLINNITWKNLRGASAGRPFLKTFFRNWENFFQSFHTKFLSSFYEISLAWKISYCLSANHNPELWCVICTGVILLALVLHLNCTALSQSELSNFFMYIIRGLTITFVIYCTALIQSEQIHFF